MTSFILKCIAMISMLIDHTSVAYFGQTTLFNVIGRIAFPIFAFQISEGYIHTKNLKKYLLRLFCFAIISQVPFMLFDSMFTNNFSSSTCPLSLDSKKSSQEPKTKANKHNNIFTFIIFIVL